MKMDVRPLRNEADYDWALAEIEACFHAPPEPDTPEAARFDVLAALIESYEAKHWPIEAPDPVEAIRARMQEVGYAQGDLARLLGSRSRASEILARRGGLTMSRPIDCTGIGTSRRSACCNRSGRTRRRGD